MPKFPKQKLVDTNQHYSLPSNTVPVKLPIKEIKLILYWRDGFSETHKGFDNVQQLADFLKNNQELATAIGYIPKAQQQ
jgi:hypothetical protein